MTTTTHNTHARTAERVKKIRTLISALQAGQLSRDEIGDLLEMGPSGVRKYLGDLAHRVEQVIAGGESFIRLAMRADEVEGYLAEIAAQASARPATASCTPQAIAARDSRRHFHILADDTHYAVRVNRAAPARDWAVAALFGAGPAAMEVRHAG
jgi:hypothetical protein